MKQYRFRILLIFIVLILSLTLIFPFSSCATNTTYKYRRSEENAKYITIAQPQTNIIGDVAITRQINSKSEFNNMVSEEKFPAAAIYTLDQYGNVIDDNGAVFASLKKILDETEYKILPIVIVLNDISVNNLVKLLQKMNFSDVCVMSKDPSLVKLAREKMPTIRGAIDFTDKYPLNQSLTMEECIKIRKIVNENMASVAVLDSRTISKENVQYLYDMQINTWIQVEESETSLHASLLSGATGVISDNTKELIHVACEKLAQNTLTRTPLNIGHKGAPCIAPENTVEGAIEAFERGANCIELDVHLSLDNKVVVMHDADTLRTCDFGLEVEKSNWEDLSKLYANKGYENIEKYMNCKIPTLEDYLIAFKGTNCRIFIEIKSYNTQIVIIIKELIDKYDMYDKCTIMTSNTIIMDALREHYPEMSLGAFCSGYIDEYDSNADMLDVMNFIGEHNATLSTYYIGCRKNAVRAAMLRGVLVSTWTFKYNFNLYEDYFVWGYSGLIADDTEVIGDFIKHWELAEFEPQKIFVDDCIELKMDLTTYDKNKTSVENINFLTIGGDGALVISNSKIIAKKSGDITLIPYYTYELNGYNVALYSEPISFQIEDNPNIINKEQNTSANENELGLVNEEQFDIINETTQVLKEKQTYNSQISENNGLWWYVIIITGVVYTILIFGFCLIKFKKIKVTPK